MNDQNKVTDKDVEKGDEKNDLRENEKLKDDLSQVSKSGTTASGEVIDKDDKLDENASKEKYKRPSAVIHQFKDMYSQCSRENIHLHQTITFLQEKQHMMSLKVIISSYSYITSSTTLGFPFHTAGIINWRCIRKVDSGRFVAPAPQRL